MCGIAGLIGRNGHKILPEDVQRMTNRLRHRGPDDEGILLFEQEQISSWAGPDTPPDVSNKHNLETLPDNHPPVLAALGHRRLAILDLSAAGHQPFHNSNSGCWLVYNGEIYNYLELRDELSALGYKFRTATDTEVVLAAYSAWGEDCLQRFNGMWAFCLFDPRRKRFFLARDRTGVKPLYWWTDEGRFAFASEIKALLSLDYIRAIPDTELIWDYLVLGLTAHDKATCFRGIRSLEPGSCLILQEDSAPRIRRWWTPALDGDTETDPKQAVIEFKRRLQRAVELRLRSDVTIGSCLSGGLDSSSLVCMIGQMLRDGSNLPQLGPQQRTFTSCFNDPRFDERSFAEMAVTESGAEPCWLYPQGDEFIADLDRLIFVQDEPFISTSIYAQYRVMQAARENGVTVMLDGQGGDELLAGYSAYSHAALADILRHHPRAFPGALRNLCRVTGRSPLHYLMQMGKEIGRMLPAEFIFTLYTRTRQDLQILQPEFLRKHRLRFSTWLQERGAANLNQRLAADVTKYNLQGLLRYEDRNSMAFSIEARAPFADDVDLIEYSLPLAAEVKLREGWSKHPLRMAMEGCVPDPIRWRRDKMGFVTPEKHWLAQHSSRLLERCLSAEDEFIDNRQLEKLLPILLTDNQGQGVSEAWRIINLKLWLQTFM